MCVGGEQKVLVGGEGEDIGRGAGAEAADELSVVYAVERDGVCLLYTSPSPRDGLLSRMPSSA